MRIARIFIAICVFHALALGGSGHSFAGLVVRIGNTFSVASQSGIPAIGDHFHSDHAGAFGNPPDKAEVGSLQDQAFSMEECRGLSEFDLAGMASGTATLQFRVFQLGGLFSLNSFPFVGNIGVSSYVGNFADDISDYSIPSSGPIGVFNTAGLTPFSTLSFDVTSLYNAQIGAGSPSFGVRLQTTPSTVTGGGAFTFDNFTLTVVSVPEPSSIHLASMAIFFLALGRRKALIPNLL